MSLWEQFLKFYTQATCRVASTTLMLHGDKVVESLATTPISYLRINCHTSSHADNGLNLGTINVPQLNVFLFKCCHVHGASSKQLNSNKDRS